MSNIICMKSIYHAEHAVMAYNIHVYIVIAEYVCVCVCGNQRQLLVGIDFYFYKPQEARRGK